MDDLWLIIGVVALFVILPIIGVVNGQKKEQQHQDWLYSMTTNLDHVKILGTRTATETIDNTNVNSTLLTLLLIYKDGRQKTIDVKSVEMHYFDKFIQA